MSFQVCPRPSLSAAQPAIWWDHEGPQEMLSDSMTGVFDLKAIETAANLGICRGRAWQIDGQLISQSQGDANIARRNKWQAENCCDKVYVHRYLRGSSYGTAGDLNIDKRAGEVFLTDQELQIELVQTPLFVQGLHLSKQLLGYDRAKHPAYIRFSNNPVVGKLLNTEMDRLYTALFLRPDETRPAFQRFIACIKVAIGSEASDLDVRRRARIAMKDLICQFIEQRLEDPDLGVNTVLKNFGVSRASLYRMFDEKGGVRQYISDRRLFRAVIDIADARKRRGSVSAAAEKWGFSSDPNFNRAVKRKFGVTPGKLVAPTTRAPIQAQNAEEIVEYFR